MIKAKYSDTFDAKIKRIRRLPRLVKESVDAATKKDVNGIVSDFKDGVRKNNFGLQQLESGTVSQKIRSGYSRPSTPLYGKGDDDPNSYINMFLVKKIKNGYRIVPRWALHHKAKIELRVLFFIHENGAVINNGKTLIRIPPRPAFRKAFARYLRKKERQETSKEVKAAIRELVRTGRVDKFRRIGK